MVTACNSIFSCGSGWCTIRFEVHISALISRCYMRPVALSPLHIVILVPCIFFFLRPPEGTCAVYIVWVDLWLRFFFKHVESHHLPSMLVASLPVKLCLLGDVNALNTNIDPENHPVEMNIICQAFINFQASFGGCTAAQQKLRP